MGIHSKRKESKLLLQMGVIMLTQTCPNMGRIPGRVPWLSDGFSDVQNSLDWDI